MLHGYWLRVATIKGGRRAEKKRLSAGLEPTRRQMRFEADRDRNSRPAKSRPRCKVGNKGGEDGELATVAG